ncbi:rhodanese-like domain-containing protein [Dechloromonas sp. HYN0024]|uniref:rhodanese-like domain-containing protein n=1 Tax=Dechloromonas sp. HYN0024 TaxID=2231055 RepID=UPI000E43FFEE|nr:rhodanese-like domain-containing protein [Dechloromonas sp. HYN0024]AXS80289.1 rhodanese-like domain-containing protein [Dechloromonas sp. HYN0024]
MKRRLNLLCAGVLVALAFVPGDFVVATASAADTSVEAPKAGWYSQLVDADFVAKYAVLPKPDGVQIIDSRPATRKFDPGHIPTAMNLHDGDFDKLADQLPTDKATLLIFYCEGVDCMLSHNSAFKAEKLGYTNIKVYAGGYPEWIKKGNMGAVSLPFLKKKLDEGAPLTLVDSRPKERKFDKGHIPGAVNIPDGDFDKMVDRLPADKASPLYFYCEGLSCKLSSDSAVKAVKLGYTQVKVVPEGYPGWVKLYGAGPTTGAPAAKVVIQTTADKDAIAIASFEKILKEASDSVFLVDVRDPAEFALGTFKGAINMPVATVEKRAGELPTDKPVIFFCSAGGRSGDALDKARKANPKIKAYFLDANVKWTKDGSYAITEN